MTELEMLKINLEIPNNLRDAFLTQLLAVAAAEIAREGITLTDSADDMNLKVMYAAYLYRKRASQEYVVAGFGSSGMPRMLRYALNNRLFAQRGESV